MIEILQAIALAASVHFAVAALYLPQYAASVAKASRPSTKIVLATWWTGTSVIVYTASGAALEVLPADNAAALRNIIGAAWTFAAFPYLIMRCAEAQQQRNTLK